MPRPHPALRLKRPQVFAHRGGSRLRPENTLTAFDHGLALGADGLEFDVHFSKDGVVVVHHDDTLERTTNGHGALAAHTLDQLQRLDAAQAWPEYVGQGIGIPRLRDVLERYRDAAMIVELKVNEPRLARAVVDEIRRADAVDRVALGSFGTRVLQAARAYEPRVVTGASREETRLALYRSWVRWRVRHPRFDAFQVPEQAGATRVVTPRFIDDAHAAGCAVQVWTVDEEADMRRLLSWGVNGIISDRPDRAVAVIRSWPSPDGK